MNKTTVKFKKLDERAQMPHYGTEFAAGADLYACLDAPLTIAKGATEFVHTGIAMEIPTGLVGLVYARSGLACKKGLAPANKVGVVDSDYRGEIMVALHNHSNEDITIESRSPFAAARRRFQYFEPGESTVSCLRRASRDHMKHHVLCTQIQLPFYSLPVRTPYYQ